ncbi:MAG: TetR family transcriptional regulator [Polaromonas sp.]|uniref:TetR family transcriptional regulator n=1 Tax=Polaromonas sp. TaxID=1869339 RepID=UPI003264F740
MARRTKEDALATRHKLLDAAEHLFQAQGVSRTSLQDIARRAGATRGAVYWHFKDKADLFNAMMERVTLPMENAFNQENDLQQNLGTPSLNSIDRIRLSTVNALRQIVTDAQTRRVFEVATQKVEYVEELQAVRLRHLAVRGGFLLGIEQAVATAAGQMNLQLPVSASAAAQGLHALIDGLIQNWLLDPEAFDLLEIGQLAIDVYLRGLGFPGAPAAAGPRGAGK